MAELLGYVERNPWWSLFWFWIICDCVKSVVQSFQRKRFHALPPPCIAAEAAMKIIRKAVSTDSSDEARTCAMKAAQIIDQNDLRIVGPP